jgi:hypothetical protein
LPFGASRLQVAQEFVCNVRPAWFAPEKRIQLLQLDIDLLWTASRVSAQRSGIGNVAPINVKF